MKVDEEAATRPRMTAEERSRRSADALTPARFAALAGVLRTPEHHLRDGRTAS